MNIAHVVCTFPPYRGGIGKSSLDFSTMMASSGNTVDVYTPKYKDSVEESDVGILNIHRIKPLLSFGNGAFIPQIFWKLKKYDLIFLHYPFFGGAEIVWLFKIFNPRVKLIVHYHMDIRGLSPLYRFLSIPSSLIKNSLLKSADLVTAGSLDYISSSDIKKIYLNNSSKFRETYFPVDDVKFTPSPNNEKKSVKKILFVGGLDKAHYFKGLDSLIDSLSMLKERNDWILQVVGNGELKEGYKNKCIEKGISNKVIFLDSVSNEELPHIYNQSDFFVLPSINRGEAFGIVLLEAMSSGLPVIASDLPGVRKVFEKEEGFLFEPGNVRDLSKKILIFLNEEVDLKIMSKNARALVEKKYSYKSISIRLNKIINEFK